MKSLDIISGMYRHMEWADAAVWSSILAHEKAASDAWLRERLHHIHAVQSAYVTIWTGAQIDWKEASSFATSADVARWGREQHRRIEAFLGGLTDDKLDEVANLPWREQLAARYGTVHDSTIGETLIQIPSHSTNHRGQVLTRLRELGCDPPTLDFIAWVWVGKPEPKWPVA